ncbi:MAG: hypothetical protein IPG71_09920 [bacterium]|nr:hypothetical protein [bacterium]
MRWMTLALLPLFVSCAHTFVIERGAPPERYADAQQFLHQKPAKLVLKTGKIWRATEWHFGPGSTVFRIDDATDRMIVMNDRIRAITTQNSGRGMRDGALIGGFAGGLAGLFLGSIAASMQEGCDDCTDKSNSGTIVLTSLGIGAGFGALSGAVLGSHTGAMRSVVYYPDPKGPSRWEYLPR